MPRLALYAGSFDPVTNGHLDVVRHAVRLADRLVIAVGVHHGKAPLFYAEERLAMLEAAEMAEHYGQREEERMRRDRQARAEDFRARYQERLAAQRAAVEAAARGRGWDFLIHRTDASVASALLALHARLSDPVA